MKILKMIAAACVALVLGFYAESARAAQAFTCDNGKIVYARFSELEQLKRTNACVARHFGLTVENAAAQTPPVSDAQPPVSQRSGERGRSRPAKSPAAAATRPAPAAKRDPAAAPLGTVQQVEAPQGSIAAVVEADSMAVGSIVAGSIAAGQALPASAAMTETPETGLVARVTAITPATRHPGDSAFVIEPDPQSDYRNVRIINGGPGSAKYFQHRQ